MVCRADCWSMGSDAKRGREHCALHSRCEGEWTRWAADETARVPERAAVAVETGHRSEAAGLLHRYRLYRALGGCGDVGGIADAR